MASTGRAIRINWSNKLEVMTCTKLTTFLLNGQAGVE